MGEFEDDIPLRMNPDERNETIKYIVNNTEYSKEDLKEYSDADLMNIKNGIARESNVYSAIELLEELGYTIIHRAKEEENENGRI